MLKHRPYRGDDGPAGDGGRRHQARPQDAGVRAAGERRGHVDAKTELGLPVDSLEYGICAIMVDLGATTPWLITNSSHEYRA